MIALNTLISCWLGYIPLLSQVHGSHIGVLGILEEIWESQVKHDLYIDSFPCKMLLKSLSPPPAYTHIMAIDPYGCSASPRREPYHANLPPQQTFSETPNPKNDNPLLLPPYPLMPPPKSLSNLLSTSTFLSRNLTSQLLTRQNLYTKPQVIEQLLSRNCNVTAARSFSKTQRKGTKMRTRIHASEEYHFYAFHPHTSFTSCSSSSSP